MTWRDATLAVWATFALVVVGCQVVALVSKGRYPTVDTLFRWLTAGRARRALVLVAWMWLGWHAFAR